MGGYIKIDRKLLRWEWYRNANTSRVFLHLLLLCEWEDKTFEGHTIPAGSVFTSVAKIGADLGLSAKEVRTALQHLQGSGEVSINPGTKWAGAGRLITVEKWASYQLKKSGKGKRKANEGQTLGKPTIIKEILRSDGMPKGHFEVDESGYEVFVPEGKGTMN